MARNLSVSETAQSDHDPWDIFAEAEQQIHSLFQTILSTATKRRDLLLRQLHCIKREYLEKEEMRKKQVQDLEKVVEQYTEIQIQQNKVLKLHEEHLNAIKEELAACQTPTPFPVCDVSTESLQPILQQLEGIGTVMESSLHLPVTDPARSIAKPGSVYGDLKEPLGICLDKEEKIYMCDCGNSRIIVLSKGGEFHKAFGKGQLNRPYGVAIGGDWVFVSDWKLDAIFKYHIWDNELANRSVKVGILGPKGLIVDENELLVTDSNNHRVAVLNLDLQFVRAIGKGKLEFPCDVRVHSNKIFVADKSRSYNVHVFSKSGDLLHSMIDLKDDTAFLSKMFRTYHMFLCFNHSIIMVTDCGLKSVQLYSLDGHFLSSVKCEGNPRGLAATGSSAIVCATDNPDTVLFL